MLWNVRSCFCAQEGGAEMVRKIMEEKMKFSTKLLQSTLNF